jgi:hypothetical protein
MDGYTNFTVDERNGYPHQDGPQFRITASAFRHAPLVGHRLTTLDEARDAVRARIINRLHEAEQEVAGWKRQLAELGQHYAPVRTLAQTLAAYRDDIVGHLTAWRETEIGGLFKFGQFSVSCGYMKTDNLVVFQLAEYDNITLHFLAEDLKTIHQLLKAAGFAHPHTAWNGEHHHSYSVKLSQADFPTRLAEAAT